MSGRSPNGGGGAIFVHGSTPQYARISGRQSEVATASEENPSEARSAAELPQEWQHHSGAVDRPQDLRPRRRKLNFRARSQVRPARIGHTELKADNDGSLPRSRRSRQSSRRQWSSPGAASERRRFNVAGRSSVTRLRKDPTVEVNPVSNPDLMTEAGSATSPRSRSPTPTYTAFSAPRCARADALGANAPVVLR